MVVLGAQPLCGEESLQNCSLSATLQISEGVPEGPCSRPCGVLDKLRMPGGKDMPHPTNSVGIPGHRKHGG